MSFVENHYKIKLLVKLAVFTCRTRISAHTARTCRKWYPVARSARNIFRFRRLWSLPTRRTITFVNCLINIFYRIITLTYNAVRFVLTRIQLLEFTYSKINLEITVDNVNFELSWLAHVFNHTPCNWNYF